MNTHAGKTPENKSQSVANGASQKQSGAESTFQFVDNRHEIVAQRKLHEIANSSPQTKQAAQLQAMTNNHSANQQPIPKNENKKSLPDNLRTGMENLSGMSLDDVKVHRNSDKPAQLQAHAYAQGTDIYLGPGQEKHLSHEAWHVVQQKQGRVKPTMQMKNKVNINDDAKLESEADIMGAKSYLQKQSGFVQQMPNIRKDIDALNSINLASVHLPNVGNVVAQRTIWKLTKEEWEKYEEGTGKSDPPSDTLGYLEGQIVDTSPPAIEKKRKPMPTRKTKKKEEDAFISHLGSAPGSISALIVGVYIGNETEDSEVLKEQQKQQEAIGGVYSSKDVHVHKIGKKGGNKVQIDQDKFESDVERTQDWRKTCVLILNAHGNLDWFFGNSPGNEAAAIRGVVNWIRTLQKERKIVFKAIVLESCHSGEELLFGPVTDYFRVQRCPARLLSDAISGVRVVGFNGNTVTMHREVLVTDAEGEQVAQKYDSNAVVFLEGKVIKGTVQKGGGGVNHSFKDLNMKHKYYKDLFSAYKKSYGDENPKTYLTHTFIGQDQGLQDNKTTFPVKTLFDQLEAKGKKDFTNLFAGHAFTVEGSIEYEEKRDEILKNAKSTLEKANADERKAIYDDVMTSLKELADGVG